MSKATTINEHAETVRQYADDLSLNRGIPSGDLHAAADHIDALTAERDRMLEQASRWHDGERWIELDADEVRRRRERAGRAIAKLGGLEAVEALAGG